MEAEFDRAALIKELEQPVVIDKNIVKKQTFKTLIGTTVVTALAAVSIYYMYKDDLEKAEEHKDKLDIEYVDEAGNVVPKYLVEGTDTEYMVDLDRSTYVDHKSTTKKNRTDDRKSRTGRRTDDRKSRKSRTDDRTDTRRKSRTDDRKSRKNSGRGRSDRR